MKFTKEIKIGLVAVLGIVVLFVGLQFLKGLSVFSSDNTMYVAFTDATGLAV
jgi:phospholipid/cholesterol/gamma-HCH transport system substrate-binding protein